LYAGLAFAFSSYDTTPVVSNKLLVHSQQRDYQTWFDVAGPKSVVPRTPKRIIGGEPASPGAYPAYGIPEGYLTGTNGLCGATLIWEDIMVSAAHCYGAFTGFSIYLGTNQLDGTGALDTRVGLQEFPHPDYDLVSFRNDIMLIKLASSSTVMPKMWNANNGVPAGGDPVRAIGFGVTELGDVSNTLLQVDLSIVNSATCVANYEGGVFPDVQMCAAETDKDSCQGDS